MQLVSLTYFIPDLVVDMRYAGNHNIAHRPIGNEYSPRLQKSAATALVSVAAGLRSKGYRLVIWDAYRTLETQRALRAVINDSHYVLENSQHCLGRAVDLTLATMNGTLLDMATDHDDFTTRAHIDAKGLTFAQEYNRQILTTAMRNHGLFEAWPFEWWHFDFIG